MYLPSIAILADFKKLIKIFSVQKVNRYNRTMYATNITIIFTYFHIHVDLLMINSRMFRFRNVTAN